MHGHKARFVATRSQIGRTRRVRIRELLTASGFGIVLLSSCTNPNPYFLQTIDTRIGTTGHVSDGGKADSGPMDDAGHPGSDDSADDADDSTSDESHTSEGHEDGDVDTSAEDSGSSSSTGEVDAGSAGGDDIDTESETETIIECPWLYRQKIVFDNREQGSQLLDFPVLLGLDDLRMMLSEVGDNAQDLRFVSADEETPLAYEIESWASASAPVSGERNAVWLKVPVIEAGSDASSVWMYYSNPAAADIDRSMDVWDVDYRGVWHFDSSALDSTANGLDGMNDGPIHVPALISGGLRFEGDQSTYVSGGQLSNFSFSAWLYPVGSNFHATIVGDDPYNELQMRSADGQADSGKITYYYDPSRGKSNGNHFSTSPLVFNVWNHIVVTREGNVARFYLNGSFDGDTSDTDIPLDPALEFDRIGSNAESRQYFEGMMDELRLSTVARSPDWIAAQYLSMSDQFVLDWGIPERTQGACDSILE